MFVRNGQALGSVLHRAAPNAGSETPEPAPAKKAAAKKAPAKAVTPEVSKPSVGDETKTTAPAPKSESTEAKPEPVKAPAAPVLKSALDVPKG